MNTRIKDGIELLDDRFPRWPQAIDLDMLDLSDSVWCVLGQVGAERSLSYSDMVEELGIYGRSWEFGFDAEPIGGAREQYGELTAQWIEAIKARAEIVFVTAYEVTRHYGGPEEGGWWYNWYSPIKVVPVSPDDAAQIKEVLETQYADHAFGDIYSVNGGVSLAVLIEDSPAESETTIRPHYE